MKRFVFAFLIVLIALPSLACAMPACPQNAGKASVSVPCHSSQNMQSGTVFDRDISRETPVVPMFVQDCMDVDFFASYTANDFVSGNADSGAVDQSFEPLFFASAFALGLVKDAQAPPERYGSSALSQDDAPYRVTQRIRL